MNSLVTFLFFFLFIQSSIFSQSLEVSDSIYMKDIEGAIYKLNNIEGEIHYVGIERDENYDGYPMIGTLSSNDEIVYRSTNSKMKNCNADMIAKSNGKYFFVGIKGEAECFACLTKDTVLFSKNYSSYFDNSIPSSVFFNDNKITLFSAKVYKKNEIYKRHILIQEYNSLGKLLVEKKLESSKTRDIEQVIKSNNGYILLGKESKADVSGKLYTSTPFILVLDKKLNILQDKSLLSNSTKNIYPSKIIPLKGNDYLLIGSIATSVNASDIWGVTVEINPEEILIKSHFLQDINQDDSVRDALIFENKIYVILPSRGNDNLWVFDMKLNVLNNILLGDPKDTSSLYSLAQKGNYIYVSSQYGYHPIIYKVKIK